MRTECAYEVEAVIFLAVIAVSYKKKNWLDLYMNRCFDQLLRAGLLFTFLDVAVRVLREYIFPGSFYVYNLSSVIPAVAMMGIAMLYFQYWLALSGHRLILKSVRSLEMILPAAVVTILDVTSPVTHLIFYYDRQGHYHAGSLEAIVLIVVNIYFAGACFVAFSRKTGLWIYRGISCLILCLVFDLSVVIQFILMKNSILLMFYAMAFMIFVCYLLYQNLDRYSDRISGGFSRAGFRKVIQEKFKYRQRFSCLFITIQNYQNIMGICEEDELADVMGEIGAILRRYGGRQNQFHIHGADFAVLQKREEESVQLYKAVAQILPSKVRIHNKSIPISYGFYMLTLDEAAYDQAEFYKMVASMKKMLRDQLHDRQLLRYQGEVKRTIDLELQIARMLKKIMQEKRCDVCIVPIVDAHTGQRHAVEAKLYMLRENGRWIPEGAIWAVAKDMGYVRELGRITLGSAMEMAMRERILEHGFKKLVVNVTPLHISSETVVREYRFLSKKYEFPLNRLCLEMTEDMSVPFERLEQHIAHLMEEGVTVVLDRYGDNVCNLQGIMKMPFRVVKISEHMVERYCQGESDVLEYQIQMLRDNGWEICLEGIEDRQHYEKVKKLGEISYLQGKYYGGLMKPEQIHSYMEEM